jgi:hypothetical protein
MTIWYADLINGNDSNDGSTWALAKKHLYSFTGAAVVAGDTVKLAKTPNSLAYSLTPTYTNTGQGIGTLSASVSCKLLLQDFGQTSPGSWTAANSATVSTSTTPIPQHSGWTTSTRRAGMVTFPVSPVANTKYAYINIATLDLSSYQELAVLFSVFSAAVPVLGHHGRYRR